MKRDANARHATDRKCAARLTKGATESMTDNQLGDWHRVGIAMLAGGLLVIASFTLRAAWASPLQNPDRQTIPTRTPTREPTEPASASPTSRPPSPSSTARPVPPTASPSGPSPTPTPGDAPTAAAPSPTESSTEPAPSPGPSATSTPPVPPTEGQLPETPTREPPVPSASAPPSAASATSAAETDVAAHASSPTPRDAGTDRARRICCPGALAIPLVLLTRSRGKRRRTG